MEKQEPTELKNSEDHTREVESEDLKEVLLKANDGESPGLFCSTLATDLSGCNTFIITVPTPVDKNNNPDFTPLYKASETVGKVLKKGDLVETFRADTPNDSEGVFIVKSNPRPSEHNNEIWGVEALPYTP